MRDYDFINTEFAGRRYSPEVKAFAFVLYKRYRVRTHTLAQALGSSTKTVWTWITNKRVSGDGGKVAERGKGGYLGLHGKRFRRKNYLPKLFASKVAAAMFRLARWLNFKREFGWMATFEEIADGLEPP